MPLSTIATNLLSYLNIYDISPKEYASRISGAAPYPTKKWNDSPWFVNAMNGYGYAANGEPLPHGLFKDALKELLDAGY